MSARAWLVAASASGVIALLQYFGASASFSPWINGTALGEAFANLRQRNQFATLTNIGLAACLWWITRCKESLPAREISPLFPMAWSLAAAALMAAGNAASSSRTGLLELVLVAGMLLWWGRLNEPEVRRVLLAAGMAYCVAVFALPRLAGLEPSTSGLLARLHDGDPVCASRLTLWNNVLHLIAQKPWLGWGWGELDYAHFVTLYPGTRFCDILDNAHNLPLHLAVELGLPLALLVCGWGTWLVWRLRPWREADPARQLAWAVLALIMLHSMLEYPLWYGPFQIATGLCIWILWATRQKKHARLDAMGCQQESARSARQFKLARSIAGCASVLLLAGVAYAAWDYHRISQIYLPPSMRSPAYRENTAQKITGSWLFRNQVRFAELTMTAVTANTAAHVNELAHELLHFSPEARVVEKLIESAVMLRRDDEAIFYLARYRVAFPTEHAQWAKTRAPTLQAPPSAD